MYHGNDRLINLAVGAVVVIVFLLIGRLKRSLRKPPSETTYRCGRCRRTFRHDARTVKAWRNGFRKFYCPGCHAAWRCKKDAEQFVRDQEYASRSGCFGVILLCVAVAVLLAAAN